MVNPFTCSKRNIFFDRINEARTFRKLSSEENIFQKCRLKKTHAQRENQIAKSCNHDRDALARC